MGRKTGCGNDAVYASRNVPTVGSNTLSPPTGWNILKMEDDSSPEMFVSTIIHATVSRETKNIDSHRLRTSNPPKDGLITEYQD
jgi:hypothetical protein